MKLSSAFSLVLLATSASAQLLRKGNGRLPSCAFRCPALTNSEQSCGGTHSSSLSTWECFCPKVYTAANSNPAAICSSTCSGSDDALVETWFTQNCGSDNGASEHGGSGGGSGSGGSGAVGASSSAAPSASAGASGAPAAVGGSSCDGSWWSCHWQWIVMVIVLAIGLVILGFGGRWLKKRHDRKRDQMREGFNTGITSRSANITDDKALPSRSGAAAFQAGADRDSPARTRDAFMPYGYGYSRSESSRVGNDSRSEIPRGGSPVNEMEKGGESSEGGAKEKLRRVLVRERSGR